MVVASRLAGLDVGNDKVKGDLNVCVPWSSHHRCKRGLLAT